MKRLGTALLLAMGIGQLPLQADDTELYYTTGAGRPQVLIIMDTSGSMGLTLEGEEGGKKDSNAPEDEQARIRIAKDTVKALIESTPAVDFGLAVFTGSDGGRIVSGIQDMNDSRRVSLLNLVENLNNGGSTPVCESLYEAYLYYAGKRHLNGKKNGTPGFDGSIFQGEDYKSPLRECERQAYVVLLSDGAPQNDWNLNNEMEEKLGLKAEDKDLLDDINVPRGPTNDDKKYDSYLSALAGWMYTSDVNEKLPGDQRIVTYTIGYSQGALAAEEILQRTAQKGGGAYYAARNAEQLGSALKTIFTDILKVSSTFASPSVAASTTNRTQNKEWLYYGLFLPSDNPRWVGNLKKLKVDASGTIVDARGNPAIDSIGNIRNSACTFWTPDAVCDNTLHGGDGNEAQVGGALEQARLDGPRRVLTDPANQLSGGSLVDLNANALKAALNVDAEGLMAIIDPDATDVDELPDYMAWLRGRDPDDEDDDGQVKDKRADIIGDPLHSKPLAINYGQGDIRVLMGTNHGYLHMFKDSGDSIEESWAYYLSDLLPKVKSLRDNEERGAHYIYGVDTPPVAYIHDNDGDGVIESDEDRVVVIVGLRRGGRGYYALDITSPDSPRRLWEVNEQSPGMASLGQTWSEPVLTRIPGHDGPVMIVGGGYDTHKDLESVGTADSMGRAVFILDAMSGELVHRFDRDVVKSSTATPLDIDDSIPARITVLDSDMDGLTDRLYATDTGANVWRMDLPTADPLSWSGYKFAELGGDLAVSDRRFFAEASVVQTSFEMKKKVSVDGEDYVASSEVPFDAVVIGSGNRSHPNAQGTADYLFMLQDRYIVTQTFDAENPAPSAILPSNLYSIAGDPFGSANDEDELLKEELALGAKLGWYYPLSTGEKSLSSPVVVYGKAYFTSYIPATEADGEACASQGTGRLYAFGLQEGFSVDLNGEQEGVTIDLGFRIPDTPQVVVPPIPDPTPENWDPELYLAGVGEGEEQRGTVATGQMLISTRTYYHYGEN